MTISVVQTAKIADAWSGSFASNVTIGNTVFLIATDYNVVTATMSATNPLYNGGSVTGATLLKDVNSGSSSPVYTAIWMLPNVASSAKTVAVTMNNGIGSSPTAGAVGLIAIEVAGLGASPTLDKSNATPATTGTAVTSGASGSITAVPEFVLASLVIFGQSMTTVGAPWTELQFTDDFSLCGYQIVTSGSASFTYNQTAAGSAASAGCIVTVKGTVSATPSPFTPAPPVRKHPAAKRTTTRVSSSKGSAPAVLPSPFTLPVTEEASRHGLIKKSRFVWSPGSPVNPGASPFSPPNVNRNAHQLDKKSRTSSSPGSPVILAGPTSSPFTPPVVNRNTRQDIRKSRSFFNVGSPFVAPSPPSPFTPPRVNRNAHELAKRSRTFKSPVIPVFPPASPFTPPTREVRAHAQGPKSKTTKSSGSPVVIVPVTPSPFSPPVKANRGKPVTAKTRHRFSKGSPYVANASPFYPPTKITRGKTAAVKSRHRKSPSPFIGGLTIQMARVNVTAYPLVVASNVSVALHLATSTVTAHPVNAIPPTIIALPTATQIVTAYRMYPPNPLIMSLAPNSGTDQFGNAYVAGFHIYSGTTNGSVISLQSTNATFGSVPTVTFLPPGVTNVTLVPQTFGFTINPGTTTQQTWMIHSSGKTNSKDDAAIQLIGQAGDSSTDAAIIFEFGGTITTTMKKVNGFSQPGWTTATLINGWTGSGGRGGLFYRYTTDYHVEIMGDIINSVTGNSNCFQLPTGYRPPFSANYPAGWNNSGGTTPPWIFIDTAGDIQVTGIATASKEIFFHIFLPLS